MSAENGKKKGLHWWPNYLKILSTVMFLLLVFMVYLAYVYPVPYKAPDIIPLPDDGENIPGPEWFFLLFWQGFWYLTGTLKRYLVLMPILSFIILVVLFFLPMFSRIPFGRIPGLKGVMDKARSMESGFKKSLIYAIPALIFAAIVMFSVVKNGHQAKVLGCDSCHNPAMGPRMDIPPTDVAKYYLTDRARQIGVGKYRAGKSGGVDASGSMTYESSEVQGYKDANWQMRHMYEPTFTW